MTEVLEHFEGSGSCIVCNKKSSDKGEHITVSFENNAPETQIQDNLDYAREKGFIVEDNGSNIYLLTRERSPMKDKITHSYNNAKTQNYSRILLNEQVVIVVLIGLAGGYAYQTLEASVRETIRFTAFGSLYALAFLIGGLVLAALIELVEFDL